MKRFSLAFVLCALMVAGASAQDARPTHIRGIVTAFDGGVLSVTGYSGTPTAGMTTKIALDPAVRITQVVRADLSALEAGKYVGVVGEPQADGTLRVQEVQVFPEGRIPRLGTGPWDLTPASTMTNAKIDTMTVTQIDRVEGRQLTLTYADAKQAVVVPVGTPIVTFTPGDPSMLIPGAKVFVIAVKAADGTLTGTIVNVGKNFLTPPM